MDNKVSHQRNPVGCAAVDETENHSASVAMGG